MRSLPALSVLLLVACAPEEEPASPEETDPGEREVVLRFEAVVGDRNADCFADHTGLGTTQALARLRDLRLYVHGVQLLRAGAEPVDVALDVKEPWQDGTVALLDFENGDGFCEGGTPETRKVVRGTAPDVPVTGVAFSIGVPLPLNHPAAAAEPAPPLDVPDLYRGSVLGYWHFRLDLRTNGPAGTFPVYVGATGCGVDSDGTPSCTSENIVRVELPAFDPDQDVVALDLATLLSGVRIDGEDTASPGCQSLVGDPDCQAIFTAYGLGAAPPRFVGVR